MKTKLIPIGNSKGFRVPKSLLEESGIKDEADMAIEKGAIVIRPLRPVQIDEGFWLSYSALAKEWDTPEEDEAWKDLQ